MRVISKGNPGKMVHTVSIRPEEPEIWRRLAAVFLTPKNLDHNQPAPNPETGIYEYTGDDAQFAEFFTHMELECKDWLLKAADEDGVNAFGEHVEPPLPVDLGDDPTDRGVKTPVRRLNHESFERLFPKRDLRRELKAADSLSPKRDVVRMRGGIA